MNFFVRIHDWKKWICQTNLVEFGDKIRSVLFNGDGKTSFDDICGHGHVNVDDEQFSNVFILDGGELVIVWCECSGEQRIDDGGDERRT